MKKFIRLCRSCRFRYHQSGMQHCYIEQYGDYAEERFRSFQMRRIVQGAMYFLGW